MTGIDLDALKSAQRRIAVLYMAGSGGEAAALDLRLAVDEIDAVLKSVTVDNLVVPRDAPSSVERAKSPLMKCWVVSVEHQGKSNRTLAARLVAADVLDYVAVELGRRRVATSNTLLNVLDDARRKFVDES